MQIEKEFAPYKPSLDMKSIGFDEPCLGYYVTVEVPNPFLVTTKISDTQGGYFTFAPLYQQAFRFFRKKYGLHVIIDEEIRPQIKDSNSKLLFEYTKDGKYAGFEYEEAELECLKKLIEIVKSK